MKKSAARTISISKLSPGVLALNPQLAALASANPKLPVRPVVAFSGQKGPEIAEKTKQPKIPTGTEREYEAMLRREHPDCRVLFERYTLKLSNDCRYVPDFAVVHPDGRVDFHEVKGAFLFGGATKSSTHTSLTKPKLAAENFPQHNFCRATKDKLKNWTREHYKPAP